MVEILAGWFGMAVLLYAWALMSGHSRRLEDLFGLVKWSLAWPLVLCWIVLLWVVGYGRGR